MKYIIVYLLVFSIYLPNSAIARDASSRVAMEGLIKSATAFCESVDGVLAGSSLGADKSKKIGQYIGVIKIQKDTLDTYLTKFKSRTGNNSEDWRLDEIDIGRCVKYADGIKDFAGKIVTDPELQNEKKVQVAARDLDHSIKEFETSMLKERP